ncbi:MAG: ornithine carbamoyltransferase [Planctomycetota bacterium]|nr:MAG: ornithine carbamoyltransferase [Planctomycetota bacterium]
MSVDLRGRHFLSMLDLSGEEILAVLDEADRLKQRFRAVHGSAASAAAAGEHPFPKPLAGKTLAMIFQKPSLRTRVSFETGMTFLGGHAIYLSPTDISLGKRETTEDIAIVLSRYVDLIMARVFGHEIVEELARHAAVPVINGLSDHEHPCQILADFQTIRERKGRLKGLRCCFIGDGNNVAHSLMLGAARVGMHMTVICPEGYEPKEAVTEQATEIGGSTGATIGVAHELAAADGADVLYTDVWASMGQEAEAEARRRVFQPYRIDAATMTRARPDAIILHCLPAHYGDEIDYETSRTPNSAIFDQAENRLHAQNALMVMLAGAR